MIDYYSPLLLPSSGIEYDEIVHIKELTVGSVMIHFDQFYMNTEIGKIIAILNNHFKHKEIKDISDMYYGDVIYIWNYLCSRSFNMNDIKKTFVCKKCENKKNVLVNLKDLDIIYLDKVKAKKEIEFQIDNNFSIFYRRRKMLDNIHFSFFTLEENQESFDFLFNYVKNQILYIKDIKKNKIIEKNFLKDLLTEVGLKKALLFFNSIRVEDYGFKSDYIAICDTCKEKNEIKLIDPIDISFFHRGLELTNENYQDFLEMIMTINSLKYVPFKDLLETPNSKLNLIVESVKKLQEQKYSKNSGSYFDQVMEDM
jgi:hypothetical protein